jgi:hypothetical protein
LDVVVGVGNGGVRLPNIMLVPGMWMRDEGCECVAAAKADPTTLNSAHACTWAALASTTLEL